MRILYLIALLLLIVAIGIFAFENREQMTLRFLDQSVSCPRSLMIGVVYLVGMLSGWVIVGLVRRSLRRITENPSR
jgi:lipopolysaccharide assembly protein A